MDSGLPWLTLTGDYSNPLMIPFLSPSDGGDGDGEYTRAKSLIATARKYRRIREELEKVRRQEDITRIVTRAGKRPTGMDE